MTEQSGFFDSVSGDRSYGADFFSEFFKYFIPDGISVSDGGLAVTASGTSMVTTVASGSAFIQGHYYNNDAPLLVTHSTADPTYDRIDRIVAQLDKNQGARAIHIVIKQGTPAASPVEPSLQSDSYIVELPIARVLITHALSTISQAKVTDERGTLLDPIQYWTQIATINSQLATKANASAVTNTGNIGGGWIKDAATGLITQWARIPLSASSGLNAGNQAYIVGNFPVTFPNTCFLCLIDIMGADASSNVVQLAHREQTILNDHINVRIKNCSAVDLSTGAMYLKAVGN